MKRKLIYFTPLIIMVALSIGFYLRLGVDQNYIPSALIQKPLPKLDLPPLFEGESRLTNMALKLDQNIGGVTVINIFASWCVPCRAEHQYITQLANMDNVNVIGLNWKDKRRDAQKWLQELGNPYSIIGFDLDGRAGIDLGIYGVPETYFMDHNGIVRHKRVGPILAQEMEREILPAIQRIFANSKK